jgi:hypothetical protein
VNHPPGREVKAWRCLRIADVAAAELRAGFTQMGPGSVMNSAVNSATAHEAVIGRIHNRVDLLIDDVAKDDFDFHCVPST